MRKKLFQNKLNCYLVICFDYLQFDFINRINIRYHECYFKMCLGNINFSHEHLLSIYFITFCFRLLENRSLGAADFFQRQFWSSVKVWPIFKFLNLLNVNAALSTAFTFNKIKILCIIDTNLMCLITSFAYVYSQIYAAADGSIKLSKI